MGNIVKVTILAAILLRCDTKNFEIQSKCFYNIFKRGMMDFCESGKFWL